jgi:hypothetical protein
MICAEPLAGKAGRNTILTKISTLPSPAMDTRLIQSRALVAKSFRLGTVGTQPLAPEPLREEPTGGVPSDVQRWTWQGEITHEIEAALAATLPVSLVRWEEKLLALTWRLKAMPELASVAGFELSPLADLWRERAIEAFHDLGVTSPAGMTAAAVRKAFQRAWTQAVCQFGNRPIDVLFRLAKETPMPDGGTERREFYWLVNLCGRLQRMADHLGKPGFPLGQHIAAELLGVSRQTALRYMRRLEADGRLTLLKRGSRQTGLATEFCWNFPKPTAEPLGESAGLMVATAIAKLQNGQHVAHKGLLGDITEQPQPAVSHLQAADGPTDRRVNRLLLPKSELQTVCNSDEPSPKLPAAATRRKWMPAKRLRRKMAPPNCYIRRLNLSQ